MKANRMTPKLFTAALAVALLAGATRAAADAPAEKVVWAKGLNDPHGMARDGDGNVVVTEFKAGQLTRFAPDGKMLGTIGRDLKSPAWVVASGKTLFVTERKANRVLRIDGDKVEPLPHSVEEPIGVLVRGGNVVVVSHTTSKVLEFPAGGGESRGEARTIHTPSGGGKYGYRCVAALPGGDLLITDEVEGRVARIPAAGGEAKLFAIGLGDPAGIVVGPDGAVYVTDERGGRVLRLSAESTAEAKPTVVAEGLGKPRGLLFLDDGSLLVADRTSGNIYRVTPPKVAAR